MPLWFTSTFSGKKKKGVQQGLCVIAGVLTYHPMKTHEGVET